MKPSISQGRVMGLPIGEQPLAKVNAQDRVRALVQTISPEFSLVPFLFLLFLHV